MKYEWILTQVSKNLSNGLQIIERKKGYKMILFAREFLKNGTKAFAFVNSCIP